MSAPARVVPVQRRAATPRPYVSIRDTRPPAAPRLTPRGERLVVQLFAVRDLARALADVLAPLALFLAVAAILVMLAP